MSSQNPLYPSGVHLRTLFLGDRRISQEKVPGDLEAGFLRVERLIQKTQDSQCLGPIQTLLFFGIGVLVNVKSVWA